MTPKRGAVCKHKRYLQRDVPELEAQVPLSVMGLAIALLGRDEIYRLSSRSSNAFLDNVQKELVPWLAKTTYI